MYPIVPFPVTFSHPWPKFQGHGVIRPIDDACLNKRMMFGRRNSLVEEKRRLEARVAQLEEEMDEEHVELEQLTERARKSAVQVYYPMSQTRKWNN